jgi:flagellin
MALTVNTNMTSLYSIGYLEKTTSDLQKTFNRISSGLRINRAGDDAAGLAVAENLDATERSLRQAKRNTNDGLSIIQVAEGATNEVANILKRMRELAVQSASDTLANAERAFIDDEYQQLSAEVDRIANITNFNGVQLADGSANIDVQVGADNSANDLITVVVGDLRTATLNLPANLLTSADARTALDDLDDAMGTVNSYRSNYGAVQNRLESTLRNLTTYNEGLQAAESRIRDADFAYESANMTKYQTMQQAGVAILGQANQLTQAPLRLLG